MKERVPPEKGSKTEARWDELIDFALGFPEAYEDHPWGERVAKVKKKVFLFSGAGPGELGFSVKLPESGREALLLPFTEPTGYGLGKSGWVSARFAEGDAFPGPLVKRWVEESYRAVAPKRLVAQLGEEAPASGTESPGRKKTARKKA